MIPRPAGWSWEARGELVLAAPADGKSVGYVTYVERRRPLARVSAVVAELERDFRFRMTRVGVPERLVTAEGEYGAVVTVDGLLLEAPVQHTLGFVFMDDSFSVIDGLALHPGHFGLDSMRSRESPVYNALRGYQVMVAIALGVESYRKGRVMAFDPVRQVMLPAPPPHKEYPPQDA